MDVVFQLCSKMDITTVAIKVVTGTTASLVEITGFRPLSKLNKVKSKVNQCVVLKITS